MLEHLASFFPHCFRFADKTNTKGDTISLIWLCFFSCSSKMIWNNDGQFESNKAYSFGGSPYQPCIYLHSGSRALKMLHVSTSSIPTVRAALVTCMSWPPKTTDTNNCTYAHIMPCVHTRSCSLCLFISLFRSLFLCSTVHNVHAKFQFSIIRSEMATQMKKQ